MACIPSELMTLEASTDAIPASSDLATLIAAADAATYNAVAGLNSFTVTPNVRRDVVPLLDYQNAEANCIIGKTFTFTGNGVVCPGDPGYEDIRTLECACQEGFFRYRERPGVTGAREIVGIGVPVFTPTHTGGEQIKYTLEIQLRVSDCRDLP